MPNKIKTIEPFWWLLFSSGGMVAALLVPIHVLIYGIAVPLGWVSKDILSYDRMHGLLQSPFVKVYLFILIAMPLFLWAHRFRFLLVDMGLKRFKTPIAVVCYGAAVIGTLVTGAILLLLQ